MRVCSLSTMLFSLALFFSQSPLHAADHPTLPSHQSAPFALIELFTSEGCSSCPPADALLRQIHLKKTADGQLIIGISEHVTYWNNLGWRDPFSAEAFTDRQQTYASRLSPEGPYTPQMVVNGRYQFVGSDTSALEKALRANLNVPHLDLQIDSLSLTPAGLNLQFALKSPVKSALDIVAVVTDDADRSNVLRGENSGRDLEHISVARVLTRVGTVHDSAEQTVNLRFPASFDAKSGSGHHLILFAQEQHQGAILGATIVPL